VPMLAASEVRLPEASSLPSWRERFGSWQSFKKDFTEHNGFRKWIWLLWGIPRLAIFFLFELIVTLCVYPCMILAKIFFTMGYFIIPKLADILMGFANVLYAVYQRGESRYQKLLHPVLKKPGTVLGFAFLLFSLSLSQMHRLGQSLLPELNQGRFIVDMELPIGTPLGRTASTILPTEQWLAEHSNVRYVHSILGASGSENRSGVGEHSIRFLIGLNSQERNAGAEKEFMTEIRNKLQSNRKIQNIQFSRPSLFQFQTPIELILYGNSLNELESKSTDAVRRLSQQNNLTDIRTSLAEGYPEIQIQYDRDRLAKIGLQSSDIARRVREKIQGEKATSISTDESRLDLVVRLTESDRRSVEQLRFLNINPNILPKIPLYTVADIEEKKGPSEIRRVDQQRAVVVTANIDGFDLASPAREIEKLFSDIDNWELGGQSEEMRRSSQSMLFAILLAVFLVYVIMASTFESIIHPFVILFTVPLALIGVVAALWLTQLPLSVVVLIGLIVLAGVVVNNAIVLVDTINRKRAGGLSRFEATEEASKLRLRPILITTLTTALGLFPLAFGYGDGAEIQQPLAITIIAGLMSSTLLTLMVIPSLYLFLSKRLERSP
ncbi:MAG: efflux RND transporter permease subunit, partial [Myxococcota bacterium]|nr:efflux RND transporter permease subunit [Myxococcota bacterium]